MHTSALLSGNLFAEIYGRQGMVVVDIGGMDVNGTLRGAFERCGMVFISVDLEPHPSVDIVIKQGERFPFEDGSVDIVVSTSCFEHDTMFWVTFKEMARIVKQGGFVYINAPSNGPYHGYPGDCWRFYPDSGRALSQWSARKPESYPLTLIESFFIHPSNPVDIWIDYVAVFKRTEEIEEVDLLVLENKCLRYALLSKNQRITPQN